MGGVFNLRRRDQGRVMKSADPADEAFAYFLDTYERAPRRTAGMARHISTVALLLTWSNGDPAEHWVEHSIERFRTATDMAYMTFAKTSSCARAIVLHGAVDGMPLLSLVTALNEASSPFSDANALVERVNINDALRRRTWRRAIALSKPERLYVFPQVEELLILSAGGDADAQSELKSIRKLLSRP